MARRRSNARTRGARARVKVTTRGTPVSYVSSRTKRIRTNCSMPIVPPIARDELVWFDELGDTFVAYESRNAARNLSAFYLFLGSFCFRGPAFAVTLDTRAPRIYHTSYRAVRKGESADVN